MGKELHIIRPKGTTIGEYEVTKIGFLMPNGEEVIIPFNKGTKIKDILSEGNPLLEVGSGLNLCCVSSRLSLDEIEKESKEWAESRSVGNKEQDDECAYDFKCGMITARNKLSK
jgi:hypothetical protein